MASHQNPPAGLLLLTGGQGRRFGGPKHSQPHPAGGTWGSHLVDVFLEVFPGAPVQLLGEPLPDRPGLTLVRDPGHGPAAALVHWASLSRDAPLDSVPRWWIVPCDQVRWTAQDLAAWHAQVLKADPEGSRWVMARSEGHTQYLGSFLSSCLIERLKGMTARSMRALAEALPGEVLEWPSACWLDVDSSEDLGIWRATGCPESLPGLQSHNHRNMAKNTSSVIPSSQTKELPQGEVDGDG